jgi:hypothetical protein
MFPFCKPDEAQEKYDNICKLKICCAGDVLSEGGSVEVVRSHADGDTVANKLLLLA